ncbi:phytanoyl-CoA dioxygenase family protein [Actinosynnema pretiosum subsp. pretiosum]|uniref:Phytanoyl-CoA dioxygenase family protein n=1 Tax=Actinosynnema pretiosum subsp. pretiosum TaxID=103721 RepID=A0AA45L767_9PSEU|nr:Phytanoyl-CoA dioxygenase [Actinosynnema pretiosum subsp. pretiosum]QUF04090.1 phytanoyl-CoA dioxygenase family protein [Actinosynnema pretiosum subsp. pretiosum]
MTSGEVDRLLPDEQDIRFYEEHGWWVSPPILTPKDIEDALFGAERYYGGDRDEKLLIEAGTDWTPAHGNVLRQNDYVSLQVDQLRRLVHHPVVARTAAMLARTSAVRLFHDQLVYKPPQVAPSQATVGWHTDIAYWKTCSSRNLITAWIPFQSVTRDMGPMTVLDRSHRWAGNDRLEYFHETDLGLIERRIDQNSDAVEEVPLIMDVGQVSFHHCRTIHGSRPNSSDRPRLALAVHMQDYTNRYVPNTDEHGRKSSHLNDFMCRKDADGNPDYADPVVCPVLWEAEGE